MDGHLIPRQPGIGPIIHLRRTGATDRLTLSSTLVIPVIPPFIKRTHG